MHILGRNFPDSARKTRYPNLAVAAANPTDYLSFNILYVVLFREYTSESVV